MGLGSYADLGGYTDMAMIELWVIFLLIGGLLITVEIAILQMAVGWVFAFGVGSLIAGIVGYWVPDMPLSILLTIVSACFIGVFFMLRMYRGRPQAGGAMSGPSQAVDPNCLGQIVGVTQSVSSRNSGMVQWSGSQWSALASADNQDGDNVIETGRQGRIVGVRGNTLIIEPVIEPTRE